MGPGADAVTTAAGVLAPLDALRARGDHRSDPARFSHLEVLAARTAAADGALRTLLHGRLLAMLKAYEEGATAARQAGGRVAAAAAVLNPGAAASLQDLQALGDMPALRGLAARLQARGPAPGPLASLVRALDGGPPEGNPGPPVAADEARATAAAPAGLQSLRSADGGWSRLRVQQQIRRSLSAVPDNPGPLNSHLLVLRALQSLQALSPACLERFVTCAETLQWLEQAQLAADTAPRARPAVKPRASPGRKGR